MGAKLKEAEAASAQAMERLGEAQAHRTETDAILYWKAEKEQVKREFEALQKLYDEQDKVYGDEINGLYEE